MNKIYRIIWNSALGQWSVVSELSRGKTKSTINSATVVADVTSSLFFGRKSLLGVTVSTLLMGSFAVGATEITIDPTITIGEFNNKAASISVNGDTVNLSGTTAFSGSTGANATYYNITGGYNAGYVTGSVDPNGLFTLSYGTQSSSVAVPDPITGGASTVNTYDNNYINQLGAGGATGLYIYKPTPAGQGPFVQAEIANVSGGGTLNFNVSGTIGNSSVKDTSYIKVTDGTANWNSVNTVSFAGSIAGVAYGSLTPYNLGISTQEYNGTFTVNTTDGPQTQTVNNLADYKAYNSWLVQQLQDGKLGSGTTAQANYNVAISAAITSTARSYLVTPDPLSIPSTDPVYIASGMRAAMEANGASATAKISNTGAITLLAGYGLVASNGGTVINNGTLTSYGSNMVAGMYANTGGKAINNGVRNVGQTSGSRTEAGYDTAYGAGATYTNNGTVNVAGWTFSSTYAPTSAGAFARAGGSVVNTGTFNVGNTTSIGPGTLMGVYLLEGSGSSFTNESGAVMYLGRESSTDITSAPIDRGGADVVLSNGGRLISVGSPGAIVNNKGSLIIGDKVQNGTAIYIDGTSAMNVVNNGNIIVKGHYSATPGVNYGIVSYSAAAATIIDNAGTIDLLGLNNIGILTGSGGKASSSGIINVAGGADPATGLRNYGLWSRNANSKITLTGTVNLAGVGAIGVHARDGGSIAIDGAGEVKFVSGTDQIGFFVYGPAASLTNTGSGVMDVSTERSTLFRMEDGADFTGGAGASSALTASGKDSTAVMVTGLTGSDVSAFNSGGMTLNLTGENATGVLVDGGAQGKIAANANINLNGVGAIAGIADGQKHDLTGAAVGTPIAGILANGALDAGALGFGSGTLLVAGANLNSSLDNVTGYIARNGATLDNSGNIIFSGKNTTGIQVLDGSVGGNTGSITLQDGGIGLIAHSSNLATTINNTGNLVLKGGTNTNRTKGIQASGSAVTVNMTGGSIDMQGQGAVGVEALDGGKVILSGTSLPTFAAQASGVSEQIAFRIVGNGSSIQTNLTAGTILDASGKKSTLFRIEDGATQSGVLQMKTSGQDSNGIWATGAGTTVVASSGSDFQILGAGAKGVYITGAAKGTLQAGTSVSLVGDGAVVGVVDGNEYDLAGNILATDTGSTLTNESNITSTLNNAIGFITQNQGLLVNKGNISLTQGTGNTGVKVINGKFENVSSDIKVNGVAVNVEGAGSVVTSTGGRIVATNGEAAIKLGQDASLNLVGSGMGTVEGQGTAHGVLLDTGAKGLVIAGAKINVNADSTIDPTVVTSTGNGVENRAEISGLQLTGTTEINVVNGKGIRTAATLAQTNSGTININGSGTGLAFETATGGVVANTSLLDMSDSKNLLINLNGVGGTGILVNTANGATVKTGASVNVSQANGGSALVVNNSADSVIQSGNLISSSTTDAVVRAEKAKSFTNTGKIIANSITAEAMSFDGAINTVLLNDTGAEIQGVIAMNGGKNNVTNKGLITGTLTAADGNNIFLFEDASILTGEATLGQGNNLVTLNGTAHTDSVVATAGTNIFTIKGIGATYNLLNGGIGGGDDNLVFDAAQHTIDVASRLKNFENVKLKNSSLVTVNDMLVLTDGGMGAGTIDIETGSEMAIRPALAGDFAFDPLLTGKGLLSVELDADTSAFDFTTNVGNQFAGTAKLGLSQFDLSGLNTTSLTAATLQTHTGNTTTVGTGVQNIGGLTLSGGTLVFGSIMPGDMTSANSIVTSTAGTLDIRGSGTVQVTMPTEVINDVPVISSRKSLFEQDDQTTLVKLVTAKGSVLGNGSAITLKDENGNLISNAQTFDINQNGTVVAEGSYDYKLMNGDGNTVDGLYIGYGLTQLDLQGTAADALILTPKAGATGKAADLSAKITGTGDLAIESGAQTVSLSNQLNDYSGDTTVRNGTLVMANDNVLGSTSNLTVENGATFKTTDGSGNYSQIVGALNTVVGASVALAEGSMLTISDTQHTGGGTIANNTLTGAGSLNVVSSELVVNGANISYTGNVIVSTVSLVTLDSAQGFGTQGTISMGTPKDRLDFNINPLSGHSSDLSKSLVGYGIVTAKNVTDLTLSGDNSGFNGVFSVETDAALRAAEQKHLGSSVIENEGVAYLTANALWELENSITGSGALVKQGSDRLIINHDLAYTGNTTVESGTLIIGDATGSTGTLSGSAMVNVMANSTLSGLGDITGAVNNQGTIASLNALAGYESLAAGNQNIGSLTNGGTIRLAGSQIGNTLTVNGNYIGGGTLVINTVLDDDSSATDKLIVTGDTSGNTGVTVNNVRGAGNQTVNGIEVVKVGGLSNGTFKLNNRAVAGAYEYFLNKGGVATPNDGGWYLRSQLPTPIDPVDPVNPDVPTPANNIIRPEAGSYMANMAAAGKLFNLRLEDREGRAENSSMWLRQQGSRTTFHDTTGQSRTATNTYVVQGGGEVWNSHFNDSDRLGVGLMVGYGNASSETGSNRSGYHSKGTVDGYSTGVYATWYQDAASLNGVYVDSWMQYSWLNGEVNGDQLSNESYNIDGLSASVEAGYRMPVYQGENGSVYITPQAQVIWSGIKADDHHEINGTRVTSSGDNNVQTRLGVKVSRDGVSDADKGSDKLFTVYAEANWLNNSQQAGAVLDGVEVKQSGSRNLAELKLGTEGQVSKNVNLWTNVAQQMGDDGYSDTALTVGFKYKF